ncbi:MAG TPA: NUDIX hydrolase [bacterium]|nr:NUDIX hydrolase [bacterium]
MIRPWKKHGKKVTYDCGFFQIHVHQSSSPLTGKKHSFYVLNTRNWVNVVALTEEGKVILVNQFRHGSGKISLEIPGGAVDHRDRSPLQAAKRELLEESGYRASRWKFLGKTHPNPAILNNTCYFYLAKGARRVSDLKLDEAEELEVVLKEFKEIPRLIRKGRIRHALVVAAFHYLDLYRKQHPGKVPGPRP